MNTTSNKLRSLLRELSIEELMELNHLVVEQIRFLESVHTHDQMMEFEPGSRVSFETNYGRQTGVLIKFNRKTVTVITDNQHRWNVSPHLLRKEVKETKEKPTLVFKSKNK